MKSVGNEQKLNFINGCFSIPERFGKAIPRNKILNFASQCTKKIQGSKNQQAVLKMERDIFGRLLAISLQKQINVEYCLSFPLAPMPPALFSCTGDMLKTNKSTLAKSLKSQVQMTQPTHIDVEVIDGFYFLYLIGSSLPQTFDKVAELILLKLCSSNAAEIHIVFDRYLTPSIKDSERQNRQGFDIPYSIKGPRQVRPTDFLGSLKNYRFKDALVEFLADYWKNDHLQSILKRKKVFITVGSECYSYQTKDSHVVITEEVDYKCEHEEADTRIMFHISKVPPTSKILVKASDTDVLIILLANMHKVPQTEIWLAGSATKTKNKDLNCINCTDLALKLGPTLCLGLPAFHAFTGCDYTAAFYNKGKVRPFKIFSKNETYQRTFAQLTDDADIFNNKKMKVVQEFTALMYGIKQCTSVNDARCRIFQKNYSTQKDNEVFLKKVKGFDSNAIPPCLNSLNQKVLRTIFVNSMWLNATEPCCAKLKPESCGWYMDGYLKPTGFLGDPTPLEVQDILLVTNRGDNEEDPAECDYNIATSDESDAE